MLEYCSLQATSPAVLEHGLVDLAQRGRRRGVERKVLEALLPVGAELGRHAPADEGLAHGRRLALQLGQLGRVLRRQRVGDGRHHLGDLHQRAFQPTQRLPQLVGVLATVETEAENAPAGDSGRLAGHRARDLGIAAHPAAERVLAPLLRPAGAAVAQVAAPELALETVDQPLQQTEALGPEGRVGGVETEGLEQLLVAQRAAGPEHGEIARLEALGRLLVDGIERADEAIAEGIGVDVEGRVDEVRDVAPKGSVGVAEDEGRAEALLLDLHPDVAELVRRQLGLGPGVMDAALELAKGDLADDGVDLVLDLGGEQHAAPRGVLLLGQQGLEGELLAEHRGRLGQRQGRAGHEIALLGRQRLVHAVAQLVGERHDVPGLALVVHQHIGMRRGDGGVAEGAAVLAGADLGVDPAPGEEIVQDAGEPGREAPVGVEHGDLGIGPGAPDVGILGQGRVAVPVFELLEAHPLGLERVVAVRDPGIGVLDGRDQRVHDLVLDLVREVARGDRPREVAPAVLDLLVLGEGVGDPAQRDPCCARARPRSTRPRPCAPHGPCWREDRRSPGRSAPCRASESAARPASRRRA